MVILTIAIFVLLGLSPIQLSAQDLAEPDTVNIVIRDKDIKDPKTATILSAVIPGAGQVYNNKIWKAPIIYGGFATNIFFIDFNNRRYKLFLNALRASDDPLEENPFPNLNRDALVRNVNFWRRNRDLNYFLFVGIYALNIIDAHVDAHLSAFDVSEDLTFKFEPTFETLTAGGNLVGFSMKINF